MIDSIVAFRRIGTESIGNSAIVASKLYDVQRFNYM